MTLDTDERFGLPDELFEVDPEFAGEEPVAPEEAIDYYGDTDQDDTEGLGGPGDAPRTPEEAIKLAKQWAKNRVYVGVGYCLKTVRSYYGVGSLYGDAETGWYAADRKVRVGPNNVPRGVPVWWTNGRYGHVALSVGGGLCLSTDWKSPGRINLARIDAIGPRWGQTFVGYSWDLNEVTVWRPDKPNPIKRKPEPKHTERNERIKAAIRKLRAANKQAKENKQEVRVKRLNKAIRYLVVTFIKNKVTRKK